MLDVKIYTQLHSPIALMDTDGPSSSRSKVSPRSKIKKDDGPVALSFLSSRLYARKTKLISKTGSVRVTQIHRES